MNQTHSQNEKEILLKYSELIKNFTKHGIEVWREEQNNKEVLRTDLPLLFLFRQILEMGDALSILIESGCINACKPLIRTLLECYLQMKFLLVDNSNRKALQFMYHYETRQKDHYEKLAFHEKSGSYSEKLKKDKHLKNFRLPESQKNAYSENVEQITNTLNDAEYNDIKNEYERISRGRKVKYWFELFNGPTNVEEILKQIEESALYEFIYRDCSRYIHAEDIIHSNLKYEESGYYKIADLRDLKQMENIVQTSILLIERCCLIFINNGVKSPKKAAEKFLPFVLEAQSYRHKDSK